VLRTELDLVKGIGKKRLRMLSLRVGPGCQIRLRGQLAEIVGRSVPLRSRSILTRAVGAEREGTSRGAFPRDTAHVRVDTPSTLRIMTHIHSPASGLHSEISEHHGHHASIDGRSLGIIALVVAGLPDVLKCQRTGHRRPMCSSIPLPTGLFDRDFAENEPMLTPTGDGGFCSARPPGAALRHRLVEIDLTRPPRSELGSFVVDDHPIVHQVTYREITGVDPPRAAPC